MIRAVGKNLQDMTGLDENATLSQVGEVLQKRQVAFVTKVLDNLNRFPSAIEKNDILQQLEGGLGDFEEAEGLRERIQQEMRENRSALQSEMRREAGGLERETARKFNDNLESRVPIYCSVSNVSSNARQTGMLRSFLIKPTPVVRGVAHGLTRMHVEHFRQSLYNGLGRLDDLKLGNVAVRGDVGEPEDGIIIDTSDPLLIEAL